MRRSSPKPAGRKLRLVIPLLLGLGGGTALWACAPFLSNWLLGEDAKVLEGPSSFFAAEIARLVPDEDRLPKAVVSVAMDETAQAEAADLSDLPGIAPERRQALAEAVRQVRQKLAESAPGGTPVAGLAVPAGLPGEIARSSTAGASPTPPSSTWTSRRPATPAPRARSGSPARRRSPPAGRRSGRWRARRSPAG